MLNNGRNGAVVLYFCAIVALLLAAVPWIDWARYGNAWVANLAALPALPGLFIAYRRSKIS